MSLSPVKRLVLEIIWMLNKPVKPIEVAKEVRMSFPTVMMHVVGLVKMGYVKAMEKGYYAITNKGREALGFPIINGRKLGRFWRMCQRKKPFTFMRM